MFFRTFCLLIIAGWFQVQCYVTVPSIYQKVELALQDYSSRRDHNPVIFSLFNVLIYDKRAKAFITNEAIEKSLEDVKKFNENDEEILREFIYGKKQLFKGNKPSIELKEDIQSALDLFFSRPNLNDYDTFDLLANNKNHDF
jgi:predicted DNA-binding protein